MTRQAPTRRPAGSPHEEDVLNHPAFGLIQASRVTSSKGFELFGSAVPARAFIKITIHDAEVAVSGTRQRYNQTRVRQEFLMSETQWGSFLSSLNVGVGTPITKTYGPSDDARLVEFPGIAGESAARTRSNAIREKTAEHLAELTSAVDDLKRLRDSSGSVSKKDLDAVLSKLTRSVKNAPSNFGHLADQLSEHLEETSAEVKTELQMFAASLGLKGGGPLALDHDTD